MKIAITTSEPSLSAAIDPRFGRAKGFAIVDTDTDEMSFKDNAQSLDLPQGAGLQAAMHVRDAGAGAVLTGHVGPKAYTALNRGGIDIYLVEHGTVGEALAAFRAGTLQRADGADKPGHW